MAETMDLFYAIDHCRAMRRLKPDPVPEALLIRLIRAGHQGPSGSNRQNSRWIVVRDPEQKRRLAALNKKHVDAYVGPPAPPEQRIAMRHQDEARQRRLVDAVRWQAEHLHEAPALIVACLKFDQRPPDTFLDGATTGGSVWPGVQNLLLVARALGLGAAPTTLPLKDRAAARAVLDMPDTMEPFCLIPVGYPLGNFGTVVRRPLREVLRWDRWSDEQPDLPED